MRIHRLRRCYTELSLGRLTERETTRPLPGSTTLTLLLFFPGRRSPERPARTPPTSASSPSPWSRATSPWSWMSRRLKGRVAAAAAWSFYVSSGEKNVTVVWLVCRVAAVLCSRRSLSSNWSQIFPLWIMSHMWVIIVLTESVHRLLRQHVGQPRLHVDAQPDVALKE